MHYHKIDKWTAIAIVIANIVGTGVFTSLGFQLLSINNAWSIASLWIIGGIIALAGALTYAEIASYLIRNGGEYHYLSQLYHPSLGFVAGFISVTIGFAAPIAAACVAFARYLLYSYFSEKSSYIEKFISLSILIGISCVHLLSIKVSAKFQKYVTLLKLFIILLFLKAFLNPNVNCEYFNWNIYTILSDIFSSGFAISLIYVSYAYSGWNAAAYIAGEIENPEKNLSKALITGTIVVIVLYVLLNMSFIYSSPLDVLKGNVEVGVISAQYIFGKTFGSIIGLLISGLLISTISSMLIASPRVLVSMGEDNQLFSIFNKRNKFHSPHFALLSIVAISALMIITSSFQWLINFIGITLILFTTLTAGGIFLLRARRNYNSVFRTPLYPITPLFFIVSNIWILIYVSIQQWSALLMSIGVILLGFILYWLMNRKNNED